MAGLYIHIPFCKQACFYCDFHFSTNLSAKTELIKAICQEIYLQKNYFSDDFSNDFSENLLQNSTSNSPQKTLQSIYFGGGTPSLLSENELLMIFEAIYANFNVAVDAEITLEANPDDLSLKTLQMLHKTPINRLSVGVQSFHNAHLQASNRAHNAQEAQTSIKLAQDIGFQRLSIDLMYAFPTENHSHKILENDLKQAVSMQVTHISAYCLTIEPKTVFGKRLERNLMKEIDEDFAADQFDILIKTLHTHAYQQYEISNFCQNGHYAVHNTNYWRGEPYLGVGASAHSFNGDSRQFNVSNNQKYIEGIAKSAKNSIHCAEIEILSAKDKINEYILTTLRTIWGCDIDKINNITEKNNLADFQEINRQTIANYIKTGLLSKCQNTLTLTNKGKFFADKIASDLFFV